MTHILFRSVSFIKKTLFFTAFSFLFTISTISVPANAAGNDSNFSVQIKNDNNQLEERLPYFHYTVKPSSKYVNIYILENKGPEPIIVDIIPANAFTNPYASFNFSKKLTSELSNFHDKDRLFSEFVDAPSNISLKGNERIEVPITIITPSNITNGEVIGGIIFEQRDQKESTNTGSTVLKSKINYIISTLLEYENEDEVSLSFGEIAFNQKFAVPRLDVEIINENGSFLKESSLTYKVYKKNGDFLFEGTLPLSRFAPSTNVLMPIQWNYESLKTGDYYVELRFSSIADEFEPITNTAPFEVTKEMLETHQVEFGEKRIIPNIDLGSFWTYLVIGILVLFSVFSGFFIARKRERKIKEKYEKDFVPKNDDKSKNNK